MAGSARTQALREKFAHRYDKLEESKRAGLFVAVGKRFFAIGGATFATLLAIEFFTTVLPLIILGFGYHNDFASDASVGDVIVHQLGLNHSEAELVRSLFGDSEALRSSWSVIGVIGFLIWGIPMAITVALMFCRAWRREPFSFGAKLWRGALWFVFYLIMIAIREGIEFEIRAEAWMRVVLVVVGLIPVWIFWTLSPVLLVRAGGVGRRSLVLAGLAGVVIDGLIVGLGERIVFPFLLDGWTAFGPVGVAMTLLTWSGVLGVTWVVIACFGAVLWERNASPDSVIAVQTTESADAQSPGAA